MNNCLDLFAITAICHDVTATDEFLTLHGISGDIICIHCGQEMKSKWGQPHIYRCNPCRISRSIFKDTIFNNCKIGRGKVLLMGYLWLMGSTQTEIEKLMQLDDKTVRYWVVLFRQCIEYDLNADQNDRMIGGDDIVVEIDETKFGKRKYNRGHRVEGVWVVGGVARTPGREMFAVKVSNRSAATLVQILQTYVRPGTTIITDCWKGYKTDGLLDLDMLHSTVNHSECFVDPNSGAHTNTIEGTWSGMKVKVPRRHRTEEMITPHLLEFVWRRKYQDNLWERFLDAIKNVYINIDNEKTV
jgi:hypothetical protein